MNKTPSVILYNANGTNERIIEKEGVHLNKFLVLIINQFLKAQKTRLYVKTK